MIPAEDGFNSLSKYKPKVVAIVIGRNEGKNLIGCINSLKGKVSNTVYVDSASSDCSVPLARNLGALVLNLPTHKFCSAARARNHGYQYVKENLRDADFIQLVDGDCVIDSGWVQLASKFLIESPQYAIASGRCVEKDINRSRYNRFCDIEWDTPVGDAITCGGVILIRRSAFEQVGGYCEDLIAGEEPEMCVRLRKLGWKIYKLDAPMAIHDADITRFTQWWNRTARAGYAFVAVWRIHCSSMHTIWGRETKSAVLWALLLPIMFLLCLLKSELILMLLLYPIQLARIWGKAIRSGDCRKKFDWAFFLLLGKFAEGFGVARYVMEHLRECMPRFFEYK